MAIRAATDGDIGAICEIAESAWKHDYPNILTRDTAESAVNEWYTPEQIEAEREHYRTVLLVAERDEAVVGFAHATVNAGGAEGSILRLYVHPEHRRKGVGRELLEQTCVDLAEWGVEQINAMVLAENEPGNDFYTHFGFEQADKRDTMIGDASYPENRYVLDRPFDLNAD